MGLILLPSISAEAQQSVTGRSEFLPHSLLSAFKPNK
jgi:hypothetical protein